MIVYVIFANASATPSPFNAEPSINKHSIVWCQFSLVSQKLTILLSKCCSICVIYFSLSRYGQVCFISKNEISCFRSCKTFNFCKPDPHLFKWVWICNIIHDQSTNRASEIISGDWPEPFLACSVPDLLLDDFGIDFFVAYTLFNSHRCTFGTASICKLFSIRSYLHSFLRYRSRMHDFPTPVSPIIIYLKRKST